MKPSYDPSPANKRQLHSAIRIGTMALALAAIVFFAWRWARPPEAAPVCRDCNVILVSLDTLSAAHLSCYGYGRTLAPNLCGFGEKNMLFKNAYANASFTLPTHASMFTGLYPRHHGITEVADTPLSRDVRTLPEMLKEQGYSTLFLSDASNQHMPRDRVYGRGVDQFFDGKEEKWPDAFRAFSENVAAHKKTFMFLYSQYVHMPYGAGEVTLPDNMAAYDWMLFSPDDATLLTPRFLDNLPYALERDIVNGVHGSSSVYQYILSEIRTDGRDYDSQRALLKKYPTILSEYQRKYDPLIRVDVSNAKELEALRNLYDERIRAFDEGPLKELIAFVSKPEIRRNTVVVITSDHGEEFGEHGAISHTTLYEPNTRVVLMMAVPGAAPRVISEYAQTVDILPTILGTLGLSSPVRHDGVSLTPAFSGRPLDPRLLMAEGPNRITVRDGKWKLFVRTAGETPVPIELYDTETDPGETANLILSHMGVVRRMMERYGEGFSQTRTGGP